MLQVWPGLVHYPDFTQGESVTNWWLDQCVDFYNGTRWGVEYDALWIVSKICQISQAYFVSYHQFIRYYKKIPSSWKIHIISDSTFHQESKVTIPSNACLLVPYLAGLEINCGSPAVVLLHGSVIAFIPIAVFCYIESRA